MHWLKALLGMGGDDRPDLFAPVPPNPAQDMLGAIDDLTRGLKNYQGAVEICSALGNLYRLRGELDQAIQIRSSLLTRTDLKRDDQARIYFELGRDYSRAGMLDRAQEAFRKCRDCGGALLPTLEQELALLYAKSADFLQASRQYKKMGHHPQAAHYLVRAAMTQRPPDTGLLAEAREIYPSSPEAWREILTLHLDQNNHDAAVQTLDQGLAVIPVELGFLLLDLFLHFDDAGSPARAALPEEYLPALLEIMGRQPQNLALLHLTGCLLRAHGQDTQAKTWQEKALLLSPTFWPARLELLTMILPQQELTPVFSLQLDFLLRLAREIKRFVCRRCGLKRGHVFFCCPKCLSWHSISFRQNLSDDDAA